MDTILASFSLLGDPMEPFPFTPAEWRRVGELALALTNATFAGDGVLSASLRNELQVYLGELRDEHSDHPLLLETQADFTEDDSERVALYRQATAIAEANDIQTLSIRLSLARVLLDLGCSAEARTELLACEAELPAVGDDSQRKEWAELLAETGRPRVS